MRRTNDLNLIILSLGLDGSRDSHGLVLVIVRDGSLELGRCLGSALADAAGLDSYFRISVRQISDGWKEHTVRGSCSSALLGSGSLGSGSLLGDTSSLLHILIDAAGVFGLLDQSLGGLLVHTAAVLDGVIGVVEVSGDSHVVDLLRKMLVRNDRVMAV